MAEIMKEVDSMEPVYRTYDDVPDWGKETVRKLLDKKFLIGGAGGILDITNSMLRVLVIGDRAGLYD